MFPDVEMTVAVTLIGAYQSYANTIGSLDPMTTLMVAALTVTGLAMLCFGGKWLVTGGVGIAQKLRISPLIIGMTVVAYGTSTPELAASLAAAGEHGDIILGNVVGSNIANVGMVIGIAAIAATLAIKKKMLMREVPMMIGFSLLLVALSADGYISQYDGALLIGLLIAFTLYIYRDAKKGDAGADDIHDEQKTPYLKLGGFIGIGMVLLGVGAWLTIENAVILAGTLGLPERVIGITVVAIGTSLPELITSVIAIRRGQTDIGVGNIVGSNIYNILMIMGIASVISGIHVAPGTFVDYLIMIAFSLSLMVGLRTGMIGRPVGMGLAAAYFAYLAYTYLAV